MTTTSKQNAEKIARQYAIVFLKEYLEKDIFIGSSIEQILAKKASVVYQNVDDPEYFGAAIQMLNKNLVAINTAQPLRLRYYSAAHELWHLEFQSGELLFIEKQNDLDHERAADHFAANIMLPESLIKTLMNNNTESTEHLIIKIADLSSMPYQAVTRRLKELGEKIPSPLLKKTEKDWQVKRIQLDFPPSFLDKSEPFTSFNDFSKEIKTQVENKEITLEMATNLIKHIDPTQAELYWEERQKLIDEWDLDDD